MIVIAKNAGFCFGVKRATERIESILSSNKGNVSIYTLGDLIHNPSYLQSLRERGVRFVQMEQISEIAKNTLDGQNAVLFVRTHGITAQEDRMLKILSNEYPSFRVENVTCPFVQRIQRIAETETADDTIFLLLGDHDHPEVRSIMSYAKGEKYALSNADALLKKLSEIKHVQKKVIIAAQTTQSTQEWKKVEKNIKKLCTNAIFFDTICDVTEKRQHEAAELSKKSDTMLVIGGKSSANTAQLVSVCKNHCQNTVWIEDANEFDPKMVLGNQISITAGASTPVDIIMEVYQKMSTTEEIMNFEEMLDESLKSLHTGDVVTGTVTEISKTGIYLDLGAKVTGSIDIEQITDAPDANLRDMFKIGDEVKAFVIHVDDNKGVATLSKKRVDQDQNWFKMAEYYEAGTILEGVVAAVVKGGLVVTIGDQKAFVPASHSTVAKGGDLSALVGTTQPVKIIDVDDRRHRALASIRLAKSETRKAEQKALWEGLAVGQQFKGKVKNLTSYGAFVDIGGVDGMVHNSELSWKRIKHASQVVSVGDEIDVYIKEIDLEKMRISLGYKTEAMDTWSAFVGQYKVGDVVPAKITSMMPFGAFAEVYADVEGLIHISRISMEKIAKPEDVLSIGQEVQVKITDIDLENRKLSLSIRALLEEAARAEAEAKRQAEKEEADRIYAEEKAQREQERAEMAPYIVGSI